MPPLISLKTNLKSLKYGGDEKGGGSSNQPYIKQSLANLDDSLAPVPILGEAELKVLRGLDDVSRISQFFVDTKSAKGILFTTNQNLLSRSSVKTEASYGLAYGGGSDPGTVNVVGTGAVNEGIYSPSSTILQVGASGLGSHFLKQGLDPTGQIDNLSIRKYSTVVGKTKPLENNRLNKLFNTKVRDYNLDQDIFLYEYSGGPGSFLGIGKTQINFSQRTGYASGILDFDAYLVGDKTSVTPDGEQLLRTGESQINPSIILKGVSAQYNKMRSPSSSAKRYRPDGDNFSYQDINVKTLDVNNEYFYPNVYDSGSLNFNSRNLNIGEQKISTDSGALILGSTENSFVSPYGKLFKGKDPKKADIIPFYVTVISNEQESEGNNIYHFPANIDSFSESLTSDWESRKYMGRGEEFFTYSMFKRNMSLSFKISPDNNDELGLMWDHLNSLAGVIMPDYSSTGFMRGTLIKLTLGEYIIDLPGILKGFNFNIVDESVSWDLDKNIPKFIEVKGFEFQPIHNFLPRKGEKLFGRTIVY